jgi:hypothetical protein
MRLVIVLGLAACFGFSECSETMAGPAKIWTCGQRTKDSCSGSGKQARCTYTNNLCVWYRVDGKVPVTDPTNCKVSHESEHIDMHDGTVKRLVYGTCTSQDAAAFR